MVGGPWPPEALPTHDAVIAINTWQRVPFATIVLPAGLKGIDAEMYEAAALAVIDVRLE